jgi:hypothetical protein
MAIDFKLKDVMHRILVKFYPAYLPDAKKPYTLRTVYQPELDVHEVASKADVYNIHTSPKIIEEGTNAFMELATYLAADGYKIKTPLFTLKVSVPGEYTGEETHLPEGTTPQMRINRGAEARQYISEHVVLQFDGKEENTGYILNTVDTYDGSTDEYLTLANPFEIHGAGLKIAADDEHAADVGIFLEGATSGTRYPVKMSLITTNHTNRLVATCPIVNIVADTEMYIIVRTQSAVKGGGTLLKDVREMKSDFTPKIRFPVITDEEKKAMGLTDNE